MYARLSSPGAAADPQCRSQEFGTDMSVPKSAPGFRDTQRSATTDEGGGLISAPDLRNYSVLVPVLKKVDGPAGNKYLANICKLYRFR